MARLGALKGADVRCLSATFMVVIFFCCVFLLTMQPSQYPTKFSMVDLPKDEVVRAQSIPALAPTTSKTPNNKGKKNGGKNDQKGNKNDKKANKAKWFKDELPKKIHIGHTSNDTLLKLEFIKEKNKDKNSDISLMKNFKTDDINMTSNIPDPQPSKTNSSVQAEQPKVPLRPQTSFSNLTSLQLKKFASPFIESQLSQGKADKKIITWHNPQSVRDILQRRKSFENCPEAQCKILYPMPAGIIADAIVFDDVDENAPPPLRNDSDQVYVFHRTRAPSFPSQDVWPSAWNSVFNWTWTYRRDSDIWHPSGLLKKAKKVKPLDYFENLTKTKSRAVAWMPQTCPTTTSSKRNEFVAELAKHVRIAEFGPCSNKSCSKADASCSENLTKKFFFLLAVEDDICKDHVTDVFYRAWQDYTHVVPVVRGGADYGAYFPEGTYIDADWFESTKHLSEFMAELMASRKMYSQLLWRKAHWVRGNKRPDELGLCTLCYKLHNLHSHRKQYPDIRQWFERRACRNPKPLY